MTKDSIRSVGIIGSGTMGQGIAQACAMAGYSVKLFDLSDELTIKATHAIEKNLQALVDKSKIDAALKHQTLAAIQRVHSLDDVYVDLVIEAVVENLQVKQDIFHHLEKIISTDAILTSNTSSLSINEIGSALTHKGRFGGLHFFNPATLMKLVEVIQAQFTDSDTVELLMKFCVSLKKQPVLVKDSPGFIVNRVARLYYVEALRLLEEGAADVQTIDQLMRNNGFKMGPFELMDLIGIDTNLSVTKSIYNSFGQDPKFKPSPIQQKKVDDNHLGRKSGKGFYDYRA